MRGKQPVFKWGEPQQQAYEHIRDALLHLAAPDFELPFHLQTDASEDGKGAVLYQLPACPIADQYPYCKDRHALNKLMQVLCLVVTVSAVYLQRPLAPSLDVQVGKGTGLAISLGTTV